MAPNKIAPVDTDASYASVELRDNPRLRARPAREASTASNSNRVLAESIPRPGQYPKLGELLILTTAKFASNSDLCFASSIRCATINPA